MRNRSLLTALLFLLTTAARAQEGRAAMADGLRADGKIWIVVAVLAVIFAGILAYLVSLDRKVTRLEREHRRPS